MADGRDRWPILYRDPTAGFESSRYTRGYGIHGNEEGSTFANDTAAARERNRRRQVTAADYIKTILGEQNNGNGPESIIWNNITQGHDQPIMTRQSFFEVLQNWESALPMQELWMVFFKIPKVVTDANVGAWGEHLIKLPVDANQDSPGALGVDTAKRLFDKPKFNTHIGCAFAQTVSLPPEQANIGHVGVQHQRGFIKGPVHEGRQVFGSLNIEFLETNVSFVDFLIRPWTILADHFGFVARPDINIRTDITLINFAKAGVDLDINERHYAGGNQGMDALAGKNLRGFVPRKIWIFQNCCPINITAERFSHTLDTSPGRRDTEWNFSRYQTFLPAHFESTMKTFHKVDDSLADAQASSTDVQKKIAKEAKQQGKEDVIQNQLRMAGVEYRGRDKRDFSTGFQGLYKMPEGDMSTLFSFWGAPPTKTMSGMDKWNYVSGVTNNAGRQATPSGSDKLDLWLSANKAIMQRPELQSGGVTRQKINHGPPRWDIFGLIGL